MCVLCVGKPGRLAGRGAGWWISSEDRVTHIVRGWRATEVHSGAPVVLFQLAGARSMVIKLAEERSLEEGGIGGPVWLFCPRARVEEASKKCVARTIKNSAPIVEMNEKFIRPRVLIAFCQDFRKYRFT